MTASRRLVAIATVLFVASCNRSDPLPPLLVNVRAASGWLGGCPQHRKPEIPLALSPEFDSRLRAQFPPGSPAEDLHETLLSQGFKDAPRCPEDQSIYSMGYVQKRYFLEQAFASVFWKADAHGRIVWTEGFVSYDGL